MHSWKHQVRRARTDGKLDQTGQKLRCYNGDWKPMCRFYGGANFRAFPVTYKVQLHLYMMPTPTFFKPLFTLDPAPPLKKHHSVFAYFHMSEGQQQSFRQYPYQLATLPNAVLPVHHNQPTMDSAVGNSLLGVEYSHWQSAALPD